MNINNGNHNQWGYLEQNRFPPNPVWQIHRQQNGQLQGTNQALNPGYPVFQVNNFYNQSSIYQSPANFYLKDNSVSTKSELPNEYKLRLSKRLDEISMSNAFMVRQPLGHQLECYPNIFLSKSSIRGNEVNIEPFTLKLNFLCSAIISKENITVRSITLMLGMKKLFTHQVVPKDINDIDVKSENCEDLQYKVNASVSFKSIDIAMPSQAAAKEINGRSDGMKRNVKEFIKKERLFILNLEAAGVPYTFKAIVIACSTSSFQIALSVYREKIDMIKELFDFLIKYPTGSKYNHQKLPMNPELPKSQISSVPHAQLRHIFDSSLNFPQANILSFIDDHIQELKNAYLHLCRINKVTKQDFLEKLPLWKKKWEALNFGPCENDGFIKLAQQVNYSNLLKQLFTEDYFFTNLVNFLDLDIFFGGITDDIVRLSSDMKAFSQLKHCYPDGFATVVIGRGLEKFSEKLFYYLVEFNSGLLHNDLNRNLSSPNSHEEKSIKVLAMVSSVSGILKTLNLNQDGLTNDVKEILIGGLSRSFSKTYPKFLISPNELTSLYCASKIPFFNISKEDDYDFLFEREKKVDTLCLTEPTVEFDALNSSPIIADVLY